MNALNASHNYTPKTEEFVYLLSVRDPEGDTSTITKVFKTYAAARRFISDILDTAYQNQNIGTSETVDYSYHVTVYDNKAVKVADFSIKRMLVNSDD
jgi:hypothetical protein